MTAQFQAGQTLVRPATEPFLADHEKRLRRLERSPAGVVVGVWITVGTPGVDGVDALIAANPAPYNVSPWIPFLDTWTNRLGPNDFPVQFKLTPDNWIRTRGVAVGGHANTAIFDLPSGYRPSSYQPDNLRSVNLGHWVELTYQSGGAVLFEAEV